MPGARPCATYEPHLADGLAGGVLYPQDTQVQPMLAAAHLLRAARAARRDRPHRGVDGDRAHPRPASG